ncbi:MAG TPA: VOC family protein [Rhizomicrobium sp.]|nr:VOC family protein [Rhizomicrobium sp.]
MLDHVNITVTDVARSRAFYDHALAPLGLRSLDADDDGALYGVTEACFVIGGGSKPTPVHIGFKAASRAAVDAFHKAGLEAGGRDHGAPGLRPQYGAHYYAAFILDPDGHNIEAVCTKG